MIQCRDSEAVSNGNLEVSGAKQRFFAVFVTGDCSDKSAGVRLSCSSEALCSTSVSSINQICVHLFIELKRCILLREVLGRQVGRRSPLVFCDLFGFIPA